MLVNRKRKLPSWMEEGTASHSKKNNNEKSWRRNGNVASPSSNAPKTTSTPITNNPLAEKETYEPSTSYDDIIRKKILFHAATEKSNDKPCTSQSREIPTNNHNSKEDDDDDTEDETMQNLYSILQENATVSPSRSKPTHELSDEEDETFQNLYSLVKENESSDQLASRDGACQRQLEIKADDSGEREEQNSSVDQVKAESLQESSEEENSLGAQDQSQHDSLQVKAEKCEGNKLDVNLAGPQKQAQKGSSEKNDQDENSSPTLQPAQNATTPESMNISLSSRQSCFYGASCYRKNPQHRIDMAHPGDSDYRDQKAKSSSNDGPDNRPLCEYGSSCYRKNPQHRLDFCHDSPKKRKARPKQLRDASHDDEDDGDFDGSSEADDFSPDGSESDDSFVTSDSMPSGESDFDPEEEEESPKKRSSKKKANPKKKKKKQE